MKSKLRSQIYKDLLSNQKKQPSCKKGCILQKSQGENIAISKVDDCDGRLMAKKIYDANLCELNLHCLLQVSLPNPSKLL